MKSLIDILNREKNLLGKIDSNEWASVYYSEELEKVRSYDVDCDAYYRDLDRIRKHMDNLLVERSKLQEELEICHGEIREYFKELFKEERP